MNVVMEWITRFSKEEGVWKDHKIWDSEKVKELWTGVWNKLKQYLPSVRISQITWRTLYNSIQKGVIIRKQRKEEERLTSSNILFDYCFNIHEGDL